MILYVGRFSPEKNVPALVRAFSLVRSHAKLVLCGEGPGEAELRRIIQELGLSERVYIGGFQQHIWSVMKAATAIISVSHVEGQPNALLEAMACHCPIIASDIPAHLEILDDASALIIDRSDCAQIVGAITDVLSNRSAADARARRARQTVELRSFAQSAAEYTALYQLVSGGASRANLPAPGLR